MDLGTKLSAFSLQGLFRGNRLGKILDGFILGLLILCIVLTPLPYGSVQSLSIFLIEIAALLCLILWSIKLVCCSDRDQLAVYRSALQKQRTAPRGPFFVRYTSLAKAARIFTLGRYPRSYAAPQLVQDQIDYRDYFSFLGYPIRNTGLEVLSFIFFAILLVQLVPLPYFLLALVSAESARVHQSASVATSSAGAFFPPSVNAFETVAKICEYGAYFILFVVAVNTLWNRRYFWILITAVLMSASFQAIYGLYEALSGKGQIFSYQKLHHTDVASGTFINSNHFSSYLAIALPLALSIALKRLDELRISGRSIAAKVSNALEIHGSQLLLMLTFIVLSGLAIVFSRSRAGIAVAFFSSCFFLFLYRWTKQKLPGKWYWVSAILALVVIGISIGLEPILRKFGNLPNDIVIARGRWQVWKDTLQIFSDFPLLGSGAGTYTEIFPKYQTVHLSTYSHAHNDFLEILSEIGFVVFLIVIVGCYHLFQRLRSLRSKRLEGYRIAQLGAFCSLISAGLMGFVHFGFQIPAISVTVSIVAALLFAKCDSTTAKVE